ncbi:8690_t:CDS:2, partial [Acaulospora morrowiae]
PSSSSFNNFDILSNIRKIDVTSLKRGQSSKFDTIYIDGLRISHYIHINEATNAEDLEKSIRFFKENYLHKVNYKLLKENFPAWLEGIGLSELDHKFGAYKWQEIIEMGWQDLRDIGINNSNMRKVLIRNFTLVKLDQARKRGIHVNSPRAQLTELEDAVPIDLDLLKKRFPEWIESIGCGIYIPNLEGKTWQEAIEMKWSNLEALGIKARGLRSRLARYLYRAKQAVYSEKGIILPGNEAKRAQTVNNTSESKSLETN